MQLRRQIAQRYLVRRQLEANGLSAEQAEIDPELRTFVDTGRSKLDAIDDLLKKEGP